MRTYKVGTKPFSSMNILEKCIVLIKGKQRVFYICDTKLDTIYRNKSSIAVVNRVMSERGYEMYQNKDYKFRWRKAKQILKHKGR